MLELCGPFFYKISYKLYTVILLGFMILNNALVSRLSYPFFKKKMIFKISLQKQTLHIFRPFLRFAADVETDVIV